MSKITILSVYDRIACFHSLRPFLLYRDQGLFTFTNSLDYCLNQDKNQILVMVRWFLKPDVVNLDVMKALREKYSRIVFFHDDAGGGIPRAQVLPFVDLFYQKALFRDRSLYRQSLYGKELYSDYAHRKFGVEDPAPKARPPVESEADLDKLRLSWNIGIGQFPKHKYRQRLAVALSRLVSMKLVPWFHSPLNTRKDFEQVIEGTRDIDVHARLGLVSQPSLAHHRRLILDKISGNPLFLTGETSQRRYNHELSSSKIVLSPFGWGELCFRDFEAVLSGALLLKPDMSHLETWPDIFQDRETYVSFRWDAEDLLEKSEEFLKDKAKRIDIAKRAYRAYHDQVETLEARFDAVLSEILSF